jgi:CRISPR system Cascade subunit CasB
MNPNLRFRDDDAASEALLAWWNALEKRRGDRAELRRAGAIVDVALTPAFQRLYARLDPQRACSAPQQDRLAAVVGLLAHLKVASDKSLPLAMSDKADAAAANPVSPLRFKRLLEAPDVDALFVGLRRTLPLVAHKADPLSIARDVFFWGDEVRKRWAYDYRWPDAND